MNNNPNDQLLALGRRLEQAGLTQFAKKTPAGDFALYRMHSVQIIRNEAEEIDTGGTCALLVTPEAPGLSGLIINCALAVCDMPEGQVRSRIYCKRIAAMLLTSRNRLAGSWEISAAKDAISLALKIAEERIEPDSMRKPRGPLNGRTMKHFFETEPGIFGMNQDEVEKIKRGIQHICNKHGHEDSYDFYTDINSNPVPKNGQWRTICGIDGMIFDKAWIPILKANQQFTEKKIRTVLRAATKAGFSSEIAAIILKYHS